MLDLRVSLPDGRSLADRAQQTQSLRERVQGWLGRASVGPGDGLLIVPCGSVHCLGMAFTIDVAFLDRKGAVLKLAPQRAPGALAWGPWIGILLPWKVMALELPAGTLATMDVRVGQRLRLEPGAR